MSMLCVADMRLVVLSGNHERDWPNTGDRFYPLVNAEDSGGERCCYLHPAVTASW